MSLESKFSADEVKSLKATFQSFDADSSGSIDAAELQSALEKLGETVARSRVNELIAEVDLDKSGTVEWNEFLQVMLKLREGGDSAFGRVAKKQEKAITTTGAGGAQHTYTEEEREAFAEHINNELSEDKHLKSILPINKNDESLFDSVKDGVLLAKLINWAVEGTIDERVINTKPKNEWMRNENHELVLQSAKGIGVSVVNIGPQDLNEARPHLVLGLIWQIIKIGLLSAIDLKNHPELVRLLEEGEELSDLLKLPPEVLLLRWFNYHLKEAGHNRRVKNFSGDIKDSENYTVLLKQICPNKECTMAPMDESDSKKRAEKMLSEADKIGCRKFVTSRDVVAGNPKLNLAFVANLFNNYPALEAINEEEYDFAELLDFDQEGSREERAFRFWIQSLGFECNNLYEDMRDGLLLLKLYDEVKPGIVNWKKVDMKPKMRFHKVSNTNYAVDLGKEMKFSMVNIGGTDIVDKNKKLILGITWQLMRAHIISMLKQLSGSGKEISDSDLLEWANKKVADANRNSKISGFKDPSISSGVFVCDLCYAVAPKSVNMDLVTPGETDEDKENNAKYAISVARKLGATLFLLWEDIVEVNPKMILTFVAGMMIAEKKRS
eukprot:gb/GECH01011441.1/.p1 GENE.gb/GECH01011441.1/~~gb/GECH01011441.1/.p1  ORF type:complete len:610 (+),score=136.96 gb/GECH01011441.1/:1-1830(+)